MKTLLLPVAGRSSRFPGMRPKWLLTMPDGQLMVEKAVSLLRMDDFDRILLICLKEHIDSYLSDSALKEILHGLGQARTEACILDEPTSSQSETVVKAIETSGVTGAFFVKDCDNMFDIHFDGGNEISVVDLNDVELIDAKNKSYVEANSLGYVTNIVEKQVVSNFFCCGGYGFNNTESFLDNFHSIDSSKEVFISHVIYSMLLNDESFVIKKADRYVDWGTLREYCHYTRAFITVFCDVDGVLFINGSKFGANGWFTDPINENLKSIKRLQDIGRLYLVITSSRPESQIEYISNCFSEAGVHVDKFVMGLPHSRRILVNDFSNTNPYPSAIAVNLERDSKLLSSILDSLTI